MNGCRSVSKQTTSTPFRMNTYPKPQGGTPARGNALRYIPVYNLPMADIFDLTSEPIRQSLAETIAWCSSQQLNIAVDETDDTQNRRLLANRGMELMDRARRESNRFWNRVLRRDYSHSTLWKEGLRLVREADIASVLPQLRQQLRSDTLRPSKSLGQLQTNVERENVVRSVIAARSRLVQPTQEIIDAYEGRFLLYVPEENCSDGASEHASTGFFDEDDAPPWDTWVAFS